MCGLLHVDKTKKKVLTKGWGRDIIYKLTRESQTD